MSERITAAIRNAYPTAKALGINYVETPAKNVGGSRRERIRDLRWIRMIAQSVIYRGREVSGGPTYVFLPRLSRRRSVGYLHRDREFSLSARRNWGVVGHKKKLGYAYGKKRIYVGDIVRVASRAAAYYEARGREFTRLVSVKVVISPIRAFAPLVPGFSNYLGLQKRRNVPSSFRSFAFLPICRSSLQHGEDPFLDFVFSEKDRFISFPLSFNLLLYAFYF